MKNILSLQQLKVKENTKLMAKSSKSMNCKNSSHASWFVCQSLKLNYFSFFILVLQEESNEENTIFTNVDFY